MIVKNEDLIIEKIKDKKTDKNKDKIQNKIEEQYDINVKKESEKLDNFLLLGENNKSTISFEKELNENQSYSCTECSSNIEIESLDESSNKLSFKCPFHGLKTMTIKNYLNDMIKKTYLFNECYNCKKKQNQINHEIFNFCSNCKLVICNNCIKDHDNQHFIIKHNKAKTKCISHPNMNNVSYCLDCNYHLCNACLKHRKHMRHRKVSIEEIEPTYEEINSLLKIINDYKDKKSSSQLEKNNRLIEIGNQYNIDKEKENDEYTKILLNTKKELENELIDNENNYNNKIFELKKKYEKELLEKKEELDKNNKKINDKYKKNDENNKNNYDYKINNLEQKYKDKVKEIENIYKDKINHFDELLKINSIVYNTYIKNKENYYHNINIINLLVNYYEKGNDISKELENNEDFMETISQKDFEMNQSKNEIFFGLNIQKENNITIKNIRKKNNILINNAFNLSFESLRKNDPIVNNKIYSHTENNNENTLKNLKNYKKEFKSENIKYSKNFINILACFYCGSIENLRKCLCKKIICKKCLEIQKNKVCANNCYIFKSGFNLTSTIYNLSKYPLPENTEINLYFEEVNWVRSGITFTEDIENKQLDTNCPEFDIYYILENLIEYYSLKGWRNFPNEKINPLKKGDNMTIFYKKGNKLNFWVNNNYIGSIKIDSNKKKSPYLLIHCRNERSKVKILSICEKFD